MDCDFCEKRAAVIAAPPATRQRNSLRQRQWRLPHGEGHFGANVIALFATRA